MTNIVQELQQDLLNPNVKLSSTLNKAYLIARKLEIPDFRDFIEKEIKGYPDDKNIPDYRVIHGVLKGRNIFRGWEQVLNVPPEMEEELAAARLTCPISEMEAIVDTDGDNNMVHIPLASVAGSKLLGVAVPMAVFFTTYKISAILETVRHLLLEWAIALEKNGILGEGLSFSEKDMALAQSIPQVSRITVTASAGATVNIGSTDNSINNA